MTTKKTSLTPFLLSHLPDSFPQHLDEDGKSAGEQAESKGKISQKPALRPADEKEDCE